MIALWLSHTEDLYALAQVALPDGLTNLQREPGGKPFLPDGPHISLAHTRGACAIAVSTFGPVGVDLELDRARPGAALARHWFTPAEAEWVALHPNDFLLLWTQKEAVGKALGTGLRGGGLRRPIPLPPRDDLTRLTTLVSDVAIASGRVGDLVVAVACAAPSILDSTIVLRTISLLS